MCGCAIDVDGVYVVGVSPHVAADEGAVSCSAKCHLQHLVYHDANTLQRNAGNTNDYLNLQIAIAQAPVALLCERRQTTVVANAVEPPTKTASLTLSKRSLTKHESLQHVCRSCTPHNIPNMRHMGVHVLWASRMKTQIVATCKYLGMRVSIA